MKRTDFILTGNSQTLPSKVICSKEIGLSNDELELSAFEKIEFILTHSIIIALLEEYVCEKDIEDFKKSLTLTTEQRQEAENCIQREETWFLYHTKRLTASNFGTGAGHHPKKNDRTPDALLFEMLFPHFFGNAATIYGTEMESTAFFNTELYAVILGICQGIPVEHIWIEEKGIYINEKYPWLGASPDGILHIIDTCGKEHLIYIEIKCPVSRAFYDHDWPHYYFDQIQGGMAITKIHHALAIVFTPRSTKIMQYSFNQFYWEHELYPKLYQFYWHAYVPLYILKDKNVLTEETLKQIIDSYDQTDTVKSLYVRFCANDIDSIINENADEINIDSIQEESKHLLKKQNVIMDH